MPKVTLTLAEPASTWIAARVDSGKWPTREAYVEALVEREREDAEKLVALHAALDEGMASGVSDRTIDEIFAAARERHLNAAG